MNNLSYLDNLIDQTGLRKDKISEQLGITRSSLKRKRENVATFTFGELVKLHKILSRSIDVSFETFITKVKHMIPDDKN